MINNGGPSGPPFLFPALYQYNQQPKFRNNDPVCALAWGYPMQIHQETIPQVSPSPAAQEERMDHFYRNCPDQGMYIFI
jgi:hypothetical protein